MRPALLLIPALALAQAPLRSRLAPPQAARAALTAEFRHPARAVLSTLEKGFDARLARSPGREPMELLGNTRGLYLDGFGAVFTSEVSLVYTASLTPFRSSFTKEDTARLHTRKLAQVPVLLEVMRQMMAALASTLEVPPTDQIVVGVSVFYLPNEDTSGLPSQIVMRAERQRLLKPDLGYQAIKTDLY